MIEEMLKIKILVPRKDAKKLIKKIGELGCVDIQEIENQKLKNKEEIEKLQNFLKEANSLNSLIKKEVKNGRKKPLEFLNFAKKNLLEIENLNKEKTIVKNKLEELKKIKDLIITQKEKEAFRYLNASLLEGKISDHQKFQENFKENLIFKKVGEEKNNFFFLYIFPKNLEKKVIIKVKDFNLHEIKIPEFSAKLEFLNYKKRLEEIELNIKQLKEDLEKTQPSFKEWEDFLFNLEWTIKVNSIIQKAPATENFIIFEGWVPKIKYEKVEKEILKNFQFCLIKKIPFEPHTAPVMLKNRFAKIFEPITKLYGLPKPTEPDPTPFLAPFFVLFFGLALSDAGYGIFLICLGIFLKFLKKKSQVSQFAPLLILLGFSTLIFGVLLGTFFGKEFAIWLNPQLQPLRALKFCFFFGVIQIASGIFIKFVHRLKNGEKTIEALSEHFSWIPILLLISLFLLEDIFQKYFISFQYLLKIAIILLILKLILHIIAKRNVLKGFFGFLGSLYNGLSFLSDTLSYSRLYALGLATGIIAYAINLVAQILKNILSVPVVSDLLFLFILFFGHFFNIIINILGAFIHSARLQFVEFFSKFLEGGGRAFQPIKIIKK